jgi:hypothetical protein
MKQILAQFRLFLISGIFIINNSNGEDRKFSPVIPLLVIDSDHFTLNTPGVKKLSTTLGIKGVLLSADNPICCVWVTKIPESIAEDNTYVILHKENTVIYVSSEKALELAVQRINKDLLVNLKLSKGVFTNKREGCLKKEEKKAKGKGV